MVQPELTIGVDLGGTNLRAMLVEAASGRVLASGQRPTEAAAGPPAVIARIVALVEQVLGEAGCPAVAGIGIGVPGLYDPASNVVRFLPNLPTTWPGVPLGPEIEQRTGRPTVLINDARAFVLAEAAFGAGQGTETVVGLTIGTGIGGGVVHRGELWWGLDGTAGEMGHQVVDAHGPPCGCGSRGCLEAFASGSAIAGQAMKAIRQGRTTALRDLVGGDLNRVTPALVVQAAAQGDVAALGILAEAGFYLGLGVANAITLFSPEVVVIGGGVSQAGEWLLEPIRETVQQRCRVTPLERVRIVPAALGEAAGAVGAARWAARQLGVGKERA